MNITIRELIPEDAAKLLRLQYLLDEETTFMLLEPDERQGDIQQISGMIESFALAEHSILIGAEEQFWHTINEL